jgi:hypothetical protein
MRAIAQAVALAVLALAPLAGLGNAPRADAQLKRVLESVGQGRLDAALNETDQLIARHPNFRLAHLVRGDLLLARVQPIARFGNTGHAANGRLDELRAEALARLRAVSEPPPANLVPRALVQLESRQTHAIVVDASRSRVYLFENANGTPRLVEHYYTTIGAFGMGKEREGDRKTPVGVYR